MRILRWLGPIAVVLVLVVGLVFHRGIGGEGKKYSIKTTTAAAPDDVAEPIRKLLRDGSVQLLDPAGKAICDVWYRKEIPADATPEQLKTGVTFREVKQSEILGAIRFHTAWTDYRKQKIKPGIYTMRLAYQPTDGKHTADVSDFQEFVLVISAKDDKRTALIETKTFHETGAESLTLGHPGVFMLWPVNKLPAEPEIQSKPKNHWVVNAKSELTVGGKATGAHIGIGLTLVGHSPAE
jgi:hypothetical protein